MAKKADQNYDDYVTVRIGYDTYLLPIHQVTNFLTLFSNMLGIDQKWSEETESYFWIVKPEINYEISSKKTTIKEAE